jgi:hypothetical protein
MFSVDHLVLFNNHEGRCSQFERQTKQHTIQYNSNKVTMTNDHRTNDVERDVQALRSSDPDLQEEGLGSTATEANGCSFQNVATGGCPYRFVPLTMDGNSHQYSPGSASLIDEVPLEKIREMTELFYEKAFRDPILDRLIRSHDDPHGDRFSKWIHQKLSGSTVWDQDRRQRDRTPVEVAGGRLAVVHDRSSAHAAAWYSPKRPPREVGRRFNLAECRLWMRLHFWAMRECGLVESNPSFADYYVRFIGHFVRVYERTAPMFARDSFRWSADPTNTERYLHNGRRMMDVLGLGLSQAIAQLPESEAEDYEWPYNQSPDHANA